ncbi:uncharacterized protein LOC119374896 [Rhipicephalus sanguineus]|uniref:uncharacterized protein LOC119374896 n=1 Tax=Rhipicephalus sanguineus TaxID=34632 RepID=UPI001892F74D|nr:uncharacterized protein LOC119374896 [Rhipicephalus sanguineus]
MGEFPDGRWWKATLRSYDPQVQVRLSLQADDDARAHGIEANIRAIYYLDETRVNAGHTKEKVWEDATVSSRAEAFRKGVTTGLRAPSGKGGRLIVLHDASENGFVHGASLVFRTKRSVTSDYHSEMDCPRVERWFKEQLLPNIEPRSVIVMDNTPDHSVQLEKLPSTSSRKAEIQSWLTEKNIPWSNDQLTPELIQVVNQNKHRFSGYRIDALAKVAGHDIVRLPPYHCEFNPIETVRSQVKGYIAVNRSFTLAGVEKLLDEAIALVTPENWARDCAHVVRLEEEAWEQDGAIKSTLDSIIITLGSDSSSCSDSSDSVLSGIEDLW